MRTVLAGIALLLLCGASVAGSNLLAPAMAQPAENVCDGSAGVYLYEGYNYRGDCLRFEADFDDLRALDFDNTVSSIVVIGDWTVTLYRDPAYSGRATTFFDSNPNLFDSEVGDDQVSSLRVLAGRTAAEQVCDGSAGIYLYEFRDYNGRCLRFNGDVPDLRFYNFDDAAASLWVVGDWRVTLYRDLNYTGINSSFGTADPNLSDDRIGANQVTSLRAEPVPTLPGFECDGAAGIYLYQDPAYSGRCLKFTASAPDLAEYAFTDQASAVRVVGAYNAILYQLPDYNGSATVVPGDDPNLGNDAVGDNQVSSLEVRRMEGPPGFVCDGGAGVYLYTEENYLGTCRKIVVDRPDLRELDFDNAVASLWMVGGYDAILYSDPSYQGVATAFSLSDPTLADDAVGVNQVTSIQVQRPDEPATLACDGGPGVYLYADPNFVGTCLRLIVDAPDLRQYGFDDRVSSVQARGDFKATLYSDPLFTGMATIVTDAVANLADSTVGDDQATSLRIRRGAAPLGVTCEGEGVYLYEDANYQGRCAKFLDSVPDLRLFDFDNLASSMQIIGNFSVAIYSDQAYRGQFSIIESSDPNLADNEIGDNQATSLRIQRR